MTRLSKLNMPEVLGYDPVTLQWIKEEILLRATVQGDIEGYPVTLYFYESDLEGLAVGEGVKNVEYTPGIYQYLTGKAQEHGILAPFRKKSAPESTDTSSSNSAPVNKWACPEHGDNMVRPAKWGKGLQCQRWEEATGAMPSWANSTEPKNISGQNRWYCKYREFTT